MDNSTAAKSAPSPIATFGERCEGRENNFDFLRFVLATFVLFYHCYPILYGLGAPSHGPIEVVAGLCGGIAVPFFFVISGFLVTRSWLADPNLWDYLQKRALRIYPGFLVASIFCALVVGPLGAENVSAYWHQFQLVKFVRWALVLVGPFIPTIFVHLPMSTGVNGSFWTLRYEGYCYLFVVFLGLVKLYRHPLWLIMLFAGLFLLRDFQTLTGHVIFPNREMHLLGNINLWSGLIPYFMAGMLFYLYRDKIPYLRWVFFVCLGLLLIFAFVNRLEVTLPICGSYVLLYLAFTQRIRLQRFARYGDFSYGVYLYAFPVQQLIVLYTRGHLNIFALFCSAFAISLGLAVLSWYLVEKPCLRLKHNSSRALVSRPETIGSAS